MKRECPQQRYLDLALIAAANGFIKKSTDSTFSIINIGYYPYQSTQDHYDHLTKVTSNWQKLVFLACKDNNFINFILSQLKDIDPWVDFMAQIYKNYRVKKVSNKLSLERYDFICDSTNTPKIVQYNLSVVGMSIFTKLAQNSLKQFHFQEPSNYLPCNASEIFVQNISRHIAERSLKGNVMMIVSAEATTFCEIQYIVKIFNENKIKVRKVQFREVFKGISVDQNQDLYYDGQMFSFVYFRHGYCLQHYQQVYPNLLQAINGKSIMANSNAICIPDITSQIVNLKRAQCELSKPQTMRKYLSEDEAKILQSTISSTLELSNMTEQKYTALLLMLKENSHKWVLKPNREAGGNNFYGDEIVKFLQSLPQQMRKGYILQEKIQSSYDDNYTINSDLILTKIRCDYQLGRFAVTSEINGQDSFNCDCGGSVLGRSDKNPQARIFLKGSVNGFCGWKIQQ